MPAAATSATPTTSPWLTGSGAGWTVGRDEISYECPEGVRTVQRTGARSTPLSWAARMGRVLVPAFLVLGLLLGVVARVWMRFISTDPEFTVSGTLGIVLGFAFFAVMQSVAALAAQRPWRDWPRRGARCLGVVGLLPLFVAAGALMAPAVVVSGLALWHPTWPRAIRWVLALIALGNVVAVSTTITSDFGMSMRSLVGICGLVLIYGCVVWAAAGTFSHPNSQTPKTTTSEAPKATTTWGRGKLVLSALDRLFLGDTGDPRTHGLG